MGKTIHYSLLAFAILVLLGVLIILNIIPPLEFLDVQGKIVWAMSLGLSLITAAWLILIYGFQIWMEGKKPPLKEMDEEKTFAVYFKKLLDCRREGLEWVIQTFFYFGIFCILYINIPLTLPLLIIGIWVFCILGAMLFYGMYVRWGRSKKFDARVAEYLHQLNQSLDLRVIYAVGFRGGRNEEEVLQDTFVNLIKREKI